MLPPLAAHHSAEQQNVLHFVKLRVERDGIGKIYADIFVNLPGERVALVHQLLHRFQLLRGRKSRFELVAARFRQLDYRVLREILAAYAEIAAPFVRMAFSLKSTGTNASSESQPLMQPSL